MKISISNLAWDPDENDQIIPILKKYNIKGIEVAPTKIWKDPTNTQEVQLKYYKNFWSRKGISIVATTSLLFGRPELIIFGSRKMRDKTLNYLSKMIRLSAYLGAKAMVFGSPKNRKTNGFSKKEVAQIAQDFFFSVGEIAKKYDIFFGIEPNPSNYGTDFINTTQEALELVQKIDHPNFRLHVDSGAMAMNEENIAQMIKRCLPYICHFHISEPNLLPIPQGVVDHLKIAQVLRALDYKNWVSVEMPLGMDLPHEQIIDSALQFVTKTYG